MLRREKFLLAVDFTEDEVQETANAYGVSIQEVTQDQLKETFQNALNTEFEGIEIIAKA